MPLDQEHDRIWRAIEGYEMPRDQSSLNFTDQLMQAHGIKRETAERAILEYKRFIYLVATAQDVRRVPSRAVDLVWHTHMLHSRDYWDAFCAAIGRPIHHSPGGKSAAHLADYHDTIAAYKSEFGAAPPKGIWRRKHKLGDYVGIVMGGLFVLAGLWTVFVATNFNGLVLALLGGFICIVNLRSLSTSGQLTFTFEGSNQWGDANGGDCGSGGDCGGD